MCTILHVSVLGRPGRHLFDLGMPDTPGNSPTLDYLGDRVGNLELYRVGRKMLRYWLSSAGWSSCSFAAPFCSEPQLHTTSGDHQ